MKSKIATVIILALVLAGCDAAKEDRLHLEAHWRDRVAIMLLKERLIKQPPDTVLTNLQNIASIRDTIFQNMDCVDTVADNSVKDTTLTKTQIDSMWSSIATHEVFVTTR